jgi:ATP-dependent RNA helicase DeaD
MSNDRYIDLARAQVQALKQLGPLRVLPVYGDQGMQQQIKRLRAGVHVVVGMPGRVMDQLRRDTLSLDAIRIFVLDEGDEMLRMGFIDDVEWILLDALTRVLEMEAPEAA